MKLIRTLKTKVRNARARRKVRKNVGVARDIGKKAVKAGLVAGGAVAARVALEELRTRRRLRSV